MKPFMLKAFTEELEECLGAKAISVASHNGDTEHIAAAQSLLREEEWLDVNTSRCTLDSIWKTG